ncbi:MAG: zf-HC2 domain-containing protein [Candidatus Poribacteria bacterium]|nr:zf-HC2 domain-containing protein [Candidatus Poribacteria bacterium]
MNRFPSHSDLTCTEVQDTLEAYLDNELDADTSASIASHVESCATCQDEVRFVQAISGALHELPRPEPPPKIFDAVSDYVRAHPNKGPRWLHRMFQLFTFSDDLTTSLARAGALACLIGIALFGTYQYQQHLTVKQASRDLYYALGELNYAVERTSIVVNEKLPDVQINEASGRPLVQIEKASRSALKQKNSISSAIHRSLDSLDRFSQNALDRKNNPSK